MPRSIDERLDATRANSARETLEERAAEQPGRFYLPELDGLRFLAFLASSSITRSPRTLQSGRSIWVPMEAPGRGHSFGPAASGWTSSLP